MAVGFVPMFDANTDSDTNWYPGLPTRSFASCTLVGQITYIITVFTYHEWRLCVSGWHGPRVFLDKTCIHQTDHDLQAHGIRKLGAFQKRSRCMVILYGEEYLQKLWTVYEVASFLALRRDSPIW